MTEKFDLKQGFCIVSGGQSGADVAALDWAIAHMVDHGGWCPKGRRSEDGPIPPHYLLMETPQANYLQRTEWNVRDSDATVIFTLTDVLDGGSKRTAQFADKLHRPWLHFRRMRSINPAPYFEGSDVIDGGRVCAVAQPGGSAMFQGSSAS